MVEFREIRDNLLLTHHGVENYRGCRRDGDKRNDITLNQVAATIQKGIKGFCGNYRFKSTYKGIEVLWKRDDTTYPDRTIYVVITYYRTKKQHRKRLYKLMDQVSAN